MKRKVLSSKLIQGLAGVVGTLMVQSAAAASAEPRRWGGLASMEWGSNLMEPGSSDHASDLTVLLAPQYRLNPHWNFSLRMAVSQSLAGTQEFLWSDAALRLGHAAVILNPYLSWIPSVAFTVPVSERSLNRESLVTAARLGNRFAADFPRIRPLARISGFYEVSGVRSFHQFTTSTMGTPNAEYRLGHWVNLGVTLSSRLSLSADFIRNSNWSYGGGARHVFSLTETLNYDFDRGVSFALSHSNEGDVLRANGQDSNISIADIQGSRVSGSLSVVF